MGCHLPLENSKCYFRTFFLPLAVINAHFRTTIMAAGTVNIVFIVTENGTILFRSGKFTVGFQKMKRRRASICSEHEEFRCSRTRSWQLYLMPHWIVPVVVVSIHGLLIQQLVLLDWFTFSSCHKEGLLGRMSTDPKKTVGTRSWLL